MDNAILNKKKVLVTGASGYLGKELIKHISLDEGIEIKALVRKGSDLSVFPEEVDIITGDLVNISKVKDKLQDIEIVYHLGGATSGTHTDLIMNTVVGTEKLLDCLKGSAAKRFVLISSFSVYNMTCLRKRAILDEHTPVEKNLNKRDSYSISKIRQEHVTVKKCKEMNLPLVIIRPGKIYGNDCYPIPPQLGLNIPGICFLSIGGSALIPFAHVTNCAEAIHLAGTVDGAEGEIINLVDDNLPTQNEFYRMYKSALGPIKRRIQIPFSLYKLLALLAEYGNKITKGNIPPIISRYRADNLWKSLRYDNKVEKNVLNWSQRVPTKEGIKEMLESVKNNEY